MERVQMMLQGKLALVDADMVKKMQRKEALVNEALALQQASRTNGSSAQQAAQAAAVIAVKIIRLNRTIRKNVRFI
jgi:hypothetical protein